MCGIFGYVGKDANASRVVLEGLRKLEYRGYDSWGIAVRRNGAAVFEKAVGNNPRRRDARERAPAPGL